MRTRARDTFATITTEGAILPPDLLDRIAAGDGDLGGLDPASYHLFGEEINEAISRSWNRLVGVWAAFKERREGVPEGQTETAGLTRERWLLPLFDALGYGRLQTQKAVAFEGKSYPVSHRWQDVPIHLVGFRTGLDERTPGIAGAARTSPHGLLQEFLNRSDDHLWAFLSNGLSLRILRDNASLTRQAYVEFDLEAMMDGEVYPDFVLLWLLCHQSRVEASEARPEECWLEKWSHAAAERGTRVREKLRNGVEEAIASLGAGFLSHRANGALHRRLYSGELSAQDYYRQLLRLVYRLLFLFVAEDRDLLLHPDADAAARDRYTSYYSTRKLRRLAESRTGGRHPDLYRQLSLVVSRLGEDDGCPELGLPALGSFLFSDEAMPDLEAAEISNRDLLDAVRALSFVESDGVYRPVDYKNLGSEELGSVYESLLELHPVLDADAGTFALEAAGGSERKTTSSYYTPDSLVSSLLDSALDPVLDEAAKRPDPEASILALKVCDPAVGSGHFLIAAAHRIAKRLAAVRTGDDEPSPQYYRKALRDVIGRCVYGVDANPMAAELCKVSLWMEALVPGLPLAFLDHHIRVGNSLLGTTPELIYDGIPSEAFKPIVGDDKQLARDYAKRNREEYKQLEAGQLTLSLRTLDNERKAIEHAYVAVEEVENGSVSEVREKAAYYEALESSSDLDHARLIHDAWCATFVWPKTKDSPEPITQELFAALTHGSEALPREIREEIERLANRYGFFHWHLAFPNIFDGKGGFDAVLGNPPWDKFTVSEEEWFASRQQEIASTKGKAKRSKLIAQLAETDPDLFLEWQLALRDAAANTHVLSRDSGLYPLTGFKERNTYHLFAERADQIVAREGRVGMVVKTGIGSADNCLPLFKKLTDNRQLVSLFDFVNTKRLFPDVQTVERFSLITFAGARGDIGSVRFATLCQDVSDLGEPGRQYLLSPEDIALMSPLNGACPLLKREQDAAIMRQIYRQFPILRSKDSSRPQDFWNVDYVRIFDMANDSGHFRRREGLEESGLTMDSRQRFVTPEEEYWPLNEGKYLYLMDHRYGSFESVPEEKRYGRKASAPTPSESQLRDPGYEIVPRYWFPRSLWLKRCREKNLRSDFQFHFRDVAGVYPDLRTAIGAICPAAPAGHKAPALVLESVGDKCADALRHLTFTALFCSLPFDYVVRNKLFSKSIGFNTLGQIPMPAPSQVLPQPGDQTSLQAHLQKLALELSFTSWGLKELGEAVGRPHPFVWDAERRFLMLRELDAAAAHFFGLDKEKLEYILSTFQTLESSEIAKYGHFRIKEVVLRCYDAMAESRQTGQSYRTVLDPPPAELPLALNEARPATVTPLRSVQPARGPAEKIEYRPPEEFPALGQAAEERERYSTTSANRQSPDANGPPASVGPEPKPIDELSPGELCEVVVRRVYEAGSIQREVLLSDAARSLKLDLDPEVRSRLEKAVNALSLIGMVSTNGEHIWSPNRR